MAVTATDLTTDSLAVQQSSYVTASISPAANTLVLLFIAARDIVSNADPSSITGAGLTWTKVTHEDYGGYRISCWRVLTPSPGSGAITINWTNNQFYCYWSIVQYNGADTGGTNGSAGVVQAVGGHSDGTSLSITLGAFSSSSNATTGGFWVIGNNSDAGPGSGFTQVGKTAQSVQVLLSEFRNDNDTTVDFSWPVTDSGLGIAAEIRAAETRARTSVVMA